MASPNRTSSAADLKSKLSDLKRRCSDSLTRDEALSLAMEAVELHIKLLKIATSSTEKAAIQKQCGSLLDEAERIKKSPSEWNAKPLDLLIEIEPLQPTKAATKKLVAPVSKRQLPQSEQLIVLRASKLNGATFPPWTDPPSSKDFFKAPGEPLFVDPVNIPLSSEQLAILDDWKRPSFAVLSAQPSLKPEQITHELVMYPEEKVDLVQDAASDCSVVASLAAVIARFSRGHDRIMSYIMYPCEEDTGHASLSPNGKHIVKLNFNGCLRKVVIDDRLPVTKTSRTLYAIDRNNPALLWPALIEKAYLKVRGGYDFPGSNSGTDLWVLTGWIPEQIYLEPEVDLSKLWKRMFKAFGYGDVLLTIGTGKMTSKAEKELGLAGEHDYAVLDLKEVVGKRLLLIKNPWLKATAWRGYNLPPFRHADSDDANNGDSEDEDWKSVASTNAVDEVSYVSIDSVLKQDLSPGTFWMDINDVLQNYESMYLNWNPGLFRFRQDIHFQWDLVTKPLGHRSPQGSFNSNLQFGMFCELGGEVWILVSRHFKDKLSQTAASRTRDGFISLYSFSGTNKRVYLSRGVSEKGPYVDSPQTLLPLSIPARTPQTIVLSEQDLPKVLHTFTLSVFSNSPLSLAPAQPKYACRETIRSSWTDNSSGGSASSPTYGQNPQFCIKVTRETSIALLLETSTEELNVHVKLLHSGGKRVFTLTARDIIVDSKEYRRGCVLAELSAKLDPGSYTIVCSTFTAGETGDFTLTVDTDLAVALKAIPKEGAGRIRTILSDASFPSGIRTIAAPLVPRRLLRINVRANYVQPRGSTAPVHTNSPLRVTIELGRGPNRQILIASAGGTFSDAISGIRTDEVDLRPDMIARQDLWLVLERLSLGLEGPGTVEPKVSVETFVDAPDVIDVGVWREWER